MVLDHPIQCLHRIKFLTFGSVSYPKCRNVLAQGAHDWSTNTHEHGAYESTQKIEQVAIRHVPHILPVGGQKKLNNAGERYADVGTHLFPLDDDQSVGRRCPAGTLLCLVRA
ncbi:copper amine oxidase, amiloride-sensitive [Anopheles sinensis]|uniref:Copper amine oxidase, amiloride-sensitive n=1 Tax=Anopheles sinensis TaxID=74873 RepID=A0A084VKX0_ANOSI|nr:copper amine oxidase, amiloride-sensitive [Anopheles sinensis]